MLIDLYSDGYFHMRRTVSCLFMSLFSMITWLLWQWFTTLEIENLYYPAASGLHVRICSWFVSLSNYSVRLPSFALMYCVAIKTASTSGNNRLFGVLIGNKCEYRTEGVATGDSRADVLYEDGARVAEELGLAYFETSCVSCSLVNIMYILPSK